MLQAEVKLRTEGLVQANPEGTCEVLVAVLD